MATIHGPHLAQRAAQPGYRHQNQNYQPGLLQPGQVIHVNSYVVTIERYLSQGGFAHVYVVQSQAPINGTRQHVLKRIAVSNESMLRDVKKEVDVMKGLRGHPNIVNLIDATSIPSPNGTFEVFILMEFCPGGGIIDMMNRRLRERLTEAEILQIFVDVCEGVACMHNLKPPLIHRDLKVENILQASQASFKLCDFGSAVTVHPRPPSTTAELRALEADINRHTTFQYRAPEMIDVYLRRPVDEKSDVWALGVLLYKLCYYTTPFEEHGQLAIINVSYRIPSYPVYSNSMKVLIASTLQEHGAQRPTVFDLLEQVHRLRGTKPLFRYVCLVHSFIANFHS
ncbi:kinase-like domain-containing protein [Cantharellus anzutake]|uniref:kinase-like domain-containing protein n=1 Tax=Cantharellus anzutake TaxID=1750568 RepID=UPI00190576B8|nr:kinase-like domain-containing protein [Cantharellus anzutake]KAF8333081.1 kinase-like domain-containing protein [Cantharellus anzutake]